VHTNTEIVRRRGELVRLVASAATENGQKIGVITCESNAEAYFLGEQLILVRLNKAN
jgi:hypothetical protein